MQQLEVETKAMASVWLSVTRALNDRRGVTASEYAILAVAIVIVVGAAVVTLNDPNTSAFVALGNAMSSTSTSMQTTLATGR